MFWGSDLLSVKLLYIRIANFISRGGTGREENHRSDSSDALSSPKYSLNKFT